MKKFYCGISETIFTDSMYFVEIVWPFPVSWASLLSPASLLFFLSDGLVNRLFLFGALGSAGVVPTRLSDSSLGQTVATPRAYPSCGYGPESIILATTYGAVFVASLPLQRWSIYGSMSRRFDGF